MLVKQSFSTKSSVDIWDASFLVRAVTLIYVCQNSQNEIIPIRDWKPEFTSGFFSICLKNVIVFCALSVFLNFNVSTLTAFSSKCQYEQIKFV